MKDVYVIYTFLRHRTKTVMRIPKLFKHKSDPEIFNTLVEQLEILEAGKNKEEWIGGYKFVTREEFELFLENNENIGTKNERK